jgi:hypothetical protein
MRTNSGTGINETAITVRDWYLEFAKSPNRRVYRGKARAKVPVRGRCMRETA